MRTFRKGYHAIKKEKWDMKIIRTWLGEWRVLKEIEDLSTCTRDDLDHVFNHVLDLRGGKKSLCPSSIVRRGDVKYSTQFVSSNERR